MTYALYIARCSDGTYYTGITTDVTRRIAEHNGEDIMRSKNIGKKSVGKGAKYTAARRPVELVYQCEFPNRSQAQKAEAQVKSLSRAEKDMLIKAEQTLFPLQTP